MKKLSILVAALFIALAVNSTRNANAEVSLEVNCGCQSTSTPTPTPIPTITPTPTSEPPAIGGPSNTPGPQMPGPSICPFPQLDPPVVTSIVRSSTSATLTWTKVNNASSYLIFYGTTQGSKEFGVPNTGNVTTYTINALNPKLQYFFDVRSVNSCMPSNQSTSGQVLGASTTMLAATGDATISRLAFAIIGGFLTFKIVKKYA